MQPEFNFHDNPLYKLPPAPPGSAEYSAYRKVLEAAGAYFALADQAEETPSFNTQTALYFAALAAFSTGQPERMLRFIDRLAPLNYKRPLLPGQPQLAKPVAPELLRLRLDALAALKKLPAGQSALELMQTARRDAADIERLEAERAKSQYAWADAAPTAGQMRANTQDSPESLLIGLHEKWLKQAATANLAATRAYLKDASAEGEYQAAYFRARLGEIDVRMIAALRRDAQKAIAAKQWSKARKLLAQLQQEWPDSDASRWAQTRLAEITTLIVKGYLAQGDALMKPPGQRYAAARPFYEKALREDKGNEHALLMLARVYKGLGQLPKVKQTLAKLEATDPQSDVLAEARQEKATAMLWLHADAKQNLAAFQDVVQKSPRAKVADEALYFSGYLLWQMGREDEARATFERLIKEYPQSAYVKWTRKDLELLR